MDHFSPEAPLGIRGTSYGYMCTLMKCRIKETFEELYIRVANEYKDVRGLNLLLEHSWCGKGCNWRTLWP